MGYMGIAPSTLPRSESRRQTEVNEDVPNTAAKQCHIPNGFSYRIRCDNRTHQTERNDNKCPAYPALQSIFPGDLN